MTPETGCNIINETIVHEDGCIEAVTDFTREQLLVVAAIAIAFVVGEVWTSWLRKGGGGALVTGLWAQ